MSSGSSTQRGWRALASQPLPWLLTALVLLAAALRLPALEHTPPGPFSDEAAIATTAYSLGTTGRDLVGNALPLYSEQRAFERWGQHDIITQPVFQYWSIPFVLMGGLDLFSARLPAAILGLLAIPAAYLLGCALFDRRVGLAAGLLLALSPWHMHFSRVGFEAIALPTLLGWAGWFMLRGLSRRSSALAATLLLALATYAYPVALVFVPLLVAIFAASQRTRLLEVWRPALACLALLLLLELPNLASLSQRGRVGDVTIGSADLSGEAAVELLEAHEGSSIAATILERRALLVPFAFAYNYASYLGPSFLFLEGDPNPRHGTGSGGVAYRFTAPLVLIGLFSLLRRAREPSAGFALGWLLAFPIAASLTTEGPHAIRAIVALPMLQIVGGLGLVTLLGAVRGSLKTALPLRIGACALGAALLLAAPFEVAARLRHYHTQYPVETAAWWQAGIGDALGEMERRRDGYDRLLVSGTIFDAYAFILFFGRIDYSTLQTQLDLNAQLQPFGYRILFYDEENPLGHSRDLLLLSARDELTGLEWRPVADFPFPDGRPHLRLIELGPPAQ